MNHNKHSDSVKSLLAIALTMAVLTAAVKAGVDNGYLGSPPPGSALQKVFDFLTDARDAKVQRGEANQAALVSAAHSIGGLFYDEVQPGHVIKPIEVSSPSQAPQAYAPASHSGP